MMIRVALIESERTELKRRALELGVSLEQVATDAIRLGAHALAADTIGSVPIIGPDPIASRKAAV